MRLRGCDRRVFERLRSDVWATAGGRKMPVLDLSDDEAEALIRLLRRTLDDARYLPKAPLAAGLGRAAGTIGGADAAVASERANP